MLQKKTIEIAVGLLILIGLAAFIMLALKVSGLNDIYTREQGYDISADFTDIGGLKPKAKVTVAGVTVGRVKKIALNKDDYIAHVTISISDNIRNLPEDTRVSVLTSGLLGDNYLGLTPGFDERFLTEGSHIPAENTDSAVVLEQLISRFVAGQATAGSTPSN